MFSYDNLGRLTQASEHRGDNSQRSYLIDYDYDRFGNRYQFALDNPASSNPLPFVAVEDSNISKTTNRFLSGLAYDDAGNVLTDSKFRLRQYTYDANNRQQWTALLDGTGAATSVYDGAGQRVATITNGVTSILVYDAMSKLVAEYGPAPVGAGGTQYVFTDHQGSTRVVTNGSGGVVSRQDYQPFGEEMGAVGQRSTDPYYGGGNSVRQQYAGMEQDEATGMSHTLWRQYDALSGRWASPDPYSGSMTIGDPQSFNRYSYVNNDPVNKVDPLGLRLIDIGVVQTEDPEYAWTLERKSMNEAGSDMATGRAVDNWNAGNGWKETLIDGGSEDAHTSNSQGPKKPGIGQNLQKSLFDLARSKVLKASVVLETIESVLERIETIQPCQDFFAWLNLGALTSLRRNSLAVRYAIGDSYIGADGTIKNFGGRGHVAQTVGDPPINGQRVASGVTTINASGVFFSNPLENGQSALSLRNSAHYGLNIAEFRDLLMMHELTHIFDPNGQFDDLGKSNAPLNRQLRLKCFPGR